MSFHPAFEPLHARLCGLDGELNGVPAHTTLALYPVDLTSYEPFLRAFYAKLELYTDAIFETVADVPIHTVARAVLGADPNWSEANARRSVALPRQVNAFVSSLAGKARGPAETVAIQSQLGMVVQVLLILSAWDEQAFASQKPLVQANFLACVAQLNTFFGLRAPA